MLLVIMSLCENNDAGTPVRPRPDDLQEVVNYVLTLEYGLE